MTFSGTPPKARNDSEDFLDKPRLNIGVFIWFDTVVTTGLYWITFCKAVLAGRAASKGFGQRRQAKPEDTARDTISVPVSSGGESYLLLRERDACDGKAGTARVMLVDVSA